MRLAQLTRRECATCGPMLFDAIGCTHCRNPHTSQTTKMSEGWMRDFIQRSNRARERKAKRVGR